MPQTELLKHENSIYGVEIEYPSYWLKEASHNQWSPLIVRFELPRESISDRYLSHVDISEAFELVKETKFDCNNN